ncbi:IS481 family transposase, partial [Ochrobactrum quorumnocens]
AVAFLSQTRKAFPFRITHVLTDRGSCFTAESFEEACAKLKVIRRTKKPYTPQNTPQNTPQTNGMVERFNGRVASEVLGINVA